MNKALEIINRMNSVKIELANVQDLLTATRSLRDLATELNFLAELTTRGERDLRAAKVDLDKKIQEYKSKLEGDLEQTNQRYEKNKKETLSLLPDVKSRIAKTTQVINEVEATAKELGVPVPVPVKEGLAMIKQIERLVSNVQANIK
jgi:DNA repair exonuclease SbcCD ATPase subunit